MAPPLLRPGDIDAPRAGGEAEEREEGDRLGEHDGRPRGEEGTRRRPRVDADDRSLALEASTADGVVVGADEFPPAAVGSAALLFSLVACRPPPHEVLGLK